MEPNKTSPTVNPTEQSPSTPPNPPLVSQPAGNPGGKKRLLLIGVAVIVALTAAGGAVLAFQRNSKKDAPKQQATLPKVKVGFMMAQTKGAASMGLGARKGVDLAIKQLGADNIEIVSEDSQCEAEAAKTSIKKLIDQHVVAIIGEGCSSASVAALPLANDAKIPMISPSASSPALSIEGDYFFRTVPSDNFQGRYLAEYAYKKGLRKIGQFYTAEPAGTAFTNVFKQRFEELGGKIVASASAESHIIDLATQAKQIAAAKPEAVTVFTNTVTSAVAFINLANQQGYQGDYFGSDALYDKTVITQTGKASDKHLIVSNFALGTKAFKQSMSNEYQSAELAYAAPQAYDALHAILLATRQGATTGEQVKSALPGIEFDGVSGYRIKFDKNGEMSDAASVKYALLQVKDGDFVEIEQ